MLEEARQKRQNRLEAEIGTLAYEHYRLSREIDARQKRLAEVDRLIAEREGALRESEQARKDIATEAAILEAQAEATAEPKEAEDHG